MRRTWIVRGSLAAYVAVLVVVVTGPWAWALNRLTVRIWATFRYDWPIAPEQVSPEDYGLLLNVVLFAPLGAGLVLLTGWSWWRVTLVAAAASTVVEVLQRVLPRDADPWDVVTNTLGATLGALVAAALVAVRRRRRSPARPAG